MFKITNKNCTLYYKNKEHAILHREDGPAVEYPNGYNAWFLNGKRHREDGPAIEYNNGKKEWYLNGKLHRLDGPAIESIIENYYFYDGKLYHHIDSDEHWMQVIKTIILL